MRISRLVLTGQLSARPSAPQAPTSTARTCSTPGGRPPSLQSRRGGTVADSQLLALWLLRRPGRQPGEHDLAVKTAALLPATTPHLPT